MKLLQITSNEDEVFEILGSHAGEFGDNGGDPDGDAWLSPVSLFPDDVVATVVASENALVVDGHEADYAPEPWHEVMDQFASGEEWCGYQHSSKAYFLNAADARLCQATHDAWMEDDDVETIAHRVHGASVS